MGIYTNNIGTADTYIQLTNPFNTGITIPFNEYITNIELNLSSSVGWWRNQADDSRSMYFYVRNNNSGSGANWNGEYDRLCTITLNGQTSNYGTTGYKSWTLSAADGKKYSGCTLYFQGQKVDDVDSTQSIMLRNASNATITVTVTTAERFTRVIAGNKIYKTDLTQTGATADDANLIKYRAKFSQGTSCSAATFNSQVLGY